MVQFRLNKRYTIGIIVVLLFIVQITPLQAQSGIPAQQESVDLAPATPLTVSAVSTGSAVLRWSAVANSMSYRVTVALPEDAREVTSFVTTETIAVINTLLPGTVYQIGIVAQNDDSLLFVDSSEVITEFMTISEEQVRIGPTVQSGVPGFLTAVKFPEVRTQPGIGGNISVEGILQFNLLTEHADDGLTGIPAVFRGGASLSLDETVYTVNIMPPHLGYAGFSSPPAIEDDWLIVARLRRLNSTPRLRIEWLDEIRQGRVALEIGVTDTALSTTATHRIVVTLGDSAVALGINNAENFSLTERTYDGIGQDISITLPEAMGGVPRTPEPGDLYSYSVFPSDPGVTLDSVGLAFDKASRILTGESVSSISLIYQVTDGIGDRINLMFAINVINTLSTPNVTVVAGENELFLSWDLVTNAVRYEVSLMTEGSADRTIQVTERTHVFSGLMANTLYKVSVVSQADGYMDSEETIIDIRTMQGQLAIPQSVMATASSNSVVVSWAPVETATTYIVSIPGTTSVETSVTSVEVFGLAPLTDYAVSVVAKAEGIRDSMGRTVLFATSAIGQLEAPGNVTAMARANSVAVSWAQVTNAMTYVVTLSDSDGDIQRLRNVPMELEYVFDELTADTLYHVGVVAQGEGYTESIVATDDVRTLQEQLESPQGLLVFVTASSAVLSWEEVEDATTYEVSISGSEEPLITTKTSLELLGLEPMTVYNISVVAEEEVYTNSDAAILSFMTPRVGQLAVPNVTVIAGENELVLSWHPVVNAMRYVLTLRDIVADVIQETAEGTESSYTFGDLSDNTLYQVSVVAQADDFEGSDAYTKDVRIGQGQLAMPQSLIVLVTASSAVLSWDEVEKATTYEVSVSGFEEPLITTTALVVLNDLEALTPYVVSVVAGAEDYTNSDEARISFMTPRVGQLAMPNVTVVAGENELVLSWHPVANATEYGVTLLSELNNVTRTVTVTRSDYTFGGLSVDTGYEVRVVAQADDFDGSNAYTANVRTMQGQLSVPRNVNAAVRANSVTVSWDAVESAEMYVINVLGIITVRTTETSVEVLDLVPNSPYIVSVVAQAMGYTNSSIAIISFTTPGVGQLAMPNVTVVVGENELMLSWHLVVDAEEYEVVLLDKDGIRETASGPELIYTFGGLLVNTEYEVRVVAQAEGFSDSNAYTANVRTMQGQLSVPRNVHAMARPSSVTVSWDAVESAEMYVVNVPGVITVRTTETSVEVLDLVPNSPYIVSVVAQAMGYMDSSMAIISFTTPGVGQLAMPNVTVVAGENELMLSWFPVTNAKMYRLTLSDRLNNVIRLVTTTRLRYTFRRLTTNTEYRVSVVAQAEGFSNSDAYIENIRTLQEQLESPQNFMTLVSASSAVLSWDSVENAETYEVSAFGIEPTVTTKTSLELLGLEPMTIYSVSVVAQAEGFIESMASMVDIRTLQEQLETPQEVITIATSNSVTVSWNGVLNATTYEVTLLDESGVIPSTVQDVMRSDHTFNGLLPNRLYRVSVIAKAERMRDSKVASTLFMTSVIGQLTMPSVRIVTEGENRLVLVWNRVENAMMYEITLLDESGVVQRPADVVQDLGSQIILYTFRALTADTSYRVSVVAQAEGYRDSVAAMMNIRTLQMRLAVPQRVIAMASTNSVMVSWEAVPGATTYVVSVSNDVMEISQMMRSVASVVVEGLVPLTAYVVRVIAQAANKRDSMVAEIPFITPVIGQLSTPMVIPEVSTGSVTVRWDRVVDATTYVTTLLDETGNIALDSVNVLSNGLMELEYTFTGLMLDTSYRVSIIARAEFYTDGDVIIEIRTLQEQLGAPMSVIVSEVSTDSVTVGWDRVADATTYVAILLDETGRIILESVNVTALSYMFEGLTEDTQYQVRIIAKGMGFRNSEMATTEVQTLQAQLAVPQNVMVTEGDRMLGVTWDEPETDDSSQITGYRIRWDADGIDEASTQVFASSRSFTIGELENGTIYTVSVSALNRREGMRAEVEESPKSVPGQPRVTIMVGDGQLAVTWGAPNNNGAEITGYTVRWEASDASSSGTEVLDENVLEYIIPNLNNGVEYTVTVFASNRLGDGEVFSGRRTPVTPGIRMMIRVFLEGALQ